MEKHCRKCQAILVPGVNWTASFAKVGNRICRPCTIEYDNTVRRQIRNCAQCGKAFSSIHKEVIFCSDACRGKSQTGTKRPQTSESLKEYYGTHPKAVEALKERGKESQFKEGHEVPDEWKMILRNNRLGKKLSEETKAKVSMNTIKFFFEHPEVREFLSKMHRGDKHWNWKGGVTEPLQLLRRSPEYNQWRKAVYERDHWTCQLCGEKINDPVAHHLLSFREYPELRFVVDNGITLCRSCHKDIHYDIGEETRFKPVADPLSIQVGLPASST